MMKQTKRASILILCVLALSNALWAQDRPNEILDKTIEALGGPDFLGVMEIQTSGQFFSFSRGELSGTDVFVDYIKFPDMERTEFVKEKNKSVTINRGKQGWKIQGKHEPEPLPAAQGEDFLMGFKTSFDYIMRFVVKDRQTTVQVLPVEIIDFKRADVLELRDLAKNRIRLFIDRETHLPAKMQVRRSDGPKVYEEIYGNWHKFQGVMTPLFVSRFTDGRKEMEIRSETAVYNPGLSDTLFSEPKTK